MRSISIAVFARCLRCATLAAMGAMLALPVNAAGIVASIDKAPVVSNGDVAGQPTDVVITFSGSLDPVVAGRGLAAGDQIRVLFPPQFDLTSLDAGYPLSDVPAPAVPCVPGMLRCTAVVLLQGWPQEPFFPPAAFHTLSIDAANNILVITALQDMVPNPPVSPGIKQVYLILNGVTNPEPGHYRIAVEAQTGSGGGWETGSGMLQILPYVRPSINATSVFVKALAAGACGSGSLWPWHPAPQPG